MTEEIWKDIRGYEGKYQISNFGNVRCLNYNRTGKAQLLKPDKDHLGYMYVVLCKNGKKAHKKIHRLVAEAFLPNPHNLPQVNHKSECKMLNFACCLEWCDRIYNCNYGTRNQRVADALSFSIDQFDKEENFIQRWKSMREIERQTGISRRNIVRCARGEKCYKTAGGYKWRFAS